MIVVKISKAYPLWPALIVPPSLLTGAMKDKCVEKLGKSKLTVVYYGTKDFGFHNLTDCLPFLENENLLKDAEPKVSQ